MRAGEGGNTIDVTSHSLLTVHVSHSCDKRLNSVGGGEKTRTQKKKQKIMDGIMGRRHHQTIFGSGCACLTAPHIDSSSHHNCRKPTRACLPALPCPAFCITTEHVTPQDYSAGNLKSATSRRIFLAAPWKLADTRSGTQSVQCSGLSPASQNVPKTPGPARPMDSVRLSVRELAGGASRFALR